MQDLLTESYSSFGSYFGYFPITSQSDYCYMIQITECVQCYLRIAWKTFCEKVQEN